MLKRGNFLAVKLPTNIKIKNFRLNDDLQILEAVNLKYAKNQTVADVVSVKQTNLFELMYFNNINVMHRWLWNYWTAWSQNYNKDAYALALKTRHK